MAFLQFDFTAQSSFETTAIRKMSGWISPENPVIRPRPTLTAHATSTRLRPARGGGGGKPGVKIRALNDREHNVRMCGARKELETENAEKVNI